MAGTGPIGPELLPPKIYERDLDNGSNDPRVGSGRDNSSGGTISHALSSGTDSASLSALGSTFVPVLVYAGVALLIFWTLRRRLSRVYGPRSIPGIRPPSELLTPILPQGWFDWVKPFFLVPDSYVLNNCSVDGFFFLRFLKVLAIISAVGCCVSWPILLPVHGTGGRHLGQLDLLTIGNIDNKVKFYAHVVTAWIYFGFVMFMISRECIYYINLRQAYLLSPRYAHRLSSRTVLFTCVPDRYLEEARLRKLFGDSVKSVWIPKNTNELRRLVKEREETAVRLEKAEVELIKAANKSRKHQLNQLDKKPRSLLTSYARGRRWGLPSPEERVVIKRETTDSEKASKPHSLEDPVTEPEKEDAKSDIQILERRVPAPESAGEPSGSGSPTSSFRNPSPARRPQRVVDPEYVHPYGLNSSLPDVNGSVAALWIPASDRPYHRPLANAFRRVDTIKWCRNRIGELNKHIAKLRRKHRAGDGTSLNAAFVEFDTLANAQAAYQVLAHHQPLHMSPRFIGIRPHEIVWSALRMKWWERIIRRFVVMGAVAAAIIFWSIPSAFIGLVSNIGYLSKNVPFLHWIAKLPDSITGVIQGLLPPLALSLLMAIVPFLLRICARTAGIPSHWMVELFVQNAYFVFQVVQVFLVTTLTSAASAAVTQIIQNPLSAKDLLSQNLPKASNFYLSYILVQCLGNGAGSLVHLFEIVRHQIVARFSNNPRLTFKTWHKLRVIHWGAVYPVFTNMGVIAISYSCIAPLILLFSSLGMCCMYYVYKYNLIYVFDTATLDSKGLFYPRALMHLMVGLYLAEICLIGLFALQVAFPQLLLMLVYLVFTLLVHISLNDALAPLMYNLPRTLALESEGFDSGDKVDDDTPTESAVPPQSQGGAAADYYDLEEQYGEEDEEDEPVLDANTIARGVEGASGFMASITGWGRTKLKASFKAEAAKLEAQAEESGLSYYIAQLKQWATPDPDKKPNFFMRWLHPEIFDDFRALSEMVDQSLPDEDEDAEHARRGYWPPEMWVPMPRLWIPKDEARVSRQEVAYTQEVVPITDHGAWLDKKGRMVVDLAETPYDMDATNAMRRFY